MKILVEETKNMFEPKIRNKENFVWFSFSKPFGHANPRKRLLELCMQEVKISARDS